MKKINGTFQTRHTLEGTYKDIDRDATKIRGLGRGQGHGYEKFCKQLYLLGVPLLRDRLFSFLCKSQEPTFGKVGGGLDV